MSENKFVHKIKEKTPFFVVSKYVQDDFLLKAEQWMLEITSGGVRKWENGPRTKEEMQPFVIDCHEGWKKVQIEIADFLIDALFRQGMALKNEKEQHRIKNKELQRIAKYNRQQIELEISVSRRMLDVILWTVLAGDHSTLRRLIVKGGEHSLSKENICVAMESANHFNENSLVIALSTDMLSLVHVGDIFLFDYENNSVKFIELKSGNKNKRITSLAEFSVSINCGEFDALTISQYDEKDKKHFYRAKKQIKRNSMIISTIRDERGTDPNSGATVVISRISASPEYWSCRISKLYKSLCEETKWAIDVIDDCLYLGVYSDPKMAYFGFNSWMEIIKCQSPIMSLTDSFRIPSSRPLGATNLPFDLKVKVLKGEVLVIMCLDILKFMALGNKIRPGSIRLATKAEVANLSKQKVGYLMFNDVPVCCVIDDKVTFMGAGQLDRIFFDQQSPKQLLEQNYISLRDK